MVVLTAQLMLLLLDTIIVMVTLADIDAELGFGPGMLPWVVTAYTLAFGGLLTHRRPARRQLRQMRVQSVRRHGQRTDQYSEE